MRLYDSSNALDVLPHGAQSFSGGDDYLTLETDGGSQMRESDAVSQRLTPMSGVNGDGGGGGMFGPLYHIENYRR